MKTDKKRLVIKRRHELKGGIFPCNGVAHMPTCTMIMINGGTDKHEAIQLQIGKGAIKNLFQTGENSWWERIERFGKDEYY